MKEMHVKMTFKGEGRMKKSLLVVVLALALMLAFAAPAFAKYAGYSSSKQYVPWAEATSLASLNPAATTQTFGPHSGYATTTIKCAVCHSVHRGGNVILNSGANGCAYCHTSTTCGGGAVAGSTKSISWAGSGPHSSCSSSYCHAGAHGVGASTYAGPASKLLVHAADSELNYLATANGVATSTFATWNATTRALATGAVCGRGGCHENSLFGVVTSGATKTLSTPAATVTGHRVIAAATATWNTTGAFAPATKTGTIAYAGVTYCNSCHDLADTSCNAGKAAFPHSITGVVDTTSGADGSWRPAVWLTAGAYAGDPNRAAVGTYNQYVITARNNTKGGVADAVSESAGSSILDGTCLKCHRGSAGASGVGMDY